MTTSVAEGWARPAGIPGVAVAGKTGTAEAVPGRPAHSWFIGFAPADNPRVVLALVVEEGGSSTQVAAPLASQILRAALVAVR
jgi:peptidoglycan glycosyltransferase